MTTFLQSGTGPFTKMGLDNPHTATAQQMAGREQDAGWAATR